MVEVLVAGSLLGLGYLVNKDNERPLDKITPSLKSNSINKRTLYHTNIVQTSNKKEETLVKKNHKKSINAIDTNIIPTHFNDRIINKRTTKIQYLEKSPTDINTYLERPQNDRNLKNRDARINNKNDAISLENFYDPISSQKLPTNDDNMYYSSLTNTYMSQDQFSHQNMVPFFSGSGVKQNTDVNATKGIFDAYQGYNNYQFPKQTIEPMFEPKKDLGFVNGTPNVSEQVFDRFVPSMYRKNEVPIQPINVGPGLNKGYSSEPVGGFQQFDSQSFALPKTTDELRTINNPKLTYESRVTGAPKSIVTNRGLQSDISKNHPETYYVQTPDMYLKTTGAYTKPEMPSKYDAKDTNRQESITYEGIAAPAATHVEPLRPSIKNSTNINYITDGPRNVNLQNYGEKDKNDYSINSYSVKPNERQTTEDKSIITNITTNVKSIIAPLLDLFRSTRKEDVIGNPNKVGYLSGPNKSVAYDPNDVTRTTLKETNIHNNTLGNMNPGAFKGPVYDPNDVTRTTLKETNIHNSQTGNMGSHITKGPAYDPNDISRTTLKETNIHNTKTGNMSIGVTKGPAHDPNDISRTTLKETNIHNTKTGNMGSYMTKGPAYDPNDITRTTLKETNIHNTKTGNMGSYITKGPAYDPNDISRTTMKETNIHNTKTGNMSNHITKGPVYDPNDITRTTMKETNIHNTQTGNMSNHITKGPVYDPNDITRTTIKETNIHNNKTGNMSNHITKGTVYDPNDITRTTLKETNIHNTKTGNMGSYITKGPAYDPNDITRTTIKETNIHNTKTGNISSGVTKGPAHDPNDIAKTTIKETNIHNTKTGNMSSGVIKGPAHDPNDITRTTIKETNIHNTKTGNMSSGVVKGPAHDPNDITRTTLKETNIHNSRTGNVFVPVKSGVVHDPHDKAKTTIKELDIDNKHFTNVRGPKRNVVYDPNDIARTTVKETNIHNNREGNVKNTTLQNGDGYLVASYEDKNTNRQFTSDLDYTGIADGQVGHGNGDGYLTGNYEDKHTNRQFTSDYEYVGVAESYLDKPSNIKMYDEARLNEIKEGVSEGRYPTLSNVKLANGADTVNIEIKKLEEDRENQYAPISDKLYTQIPTLTKCTVTTDKNILNDKSISQRINPEILDAFKSNPYTQPLNSYI